MLGNMQWSRMQHGYSSHGDEIGQTVAMTTLVVAQVSRLISKLLHYFFLFIPSLPCRRCMSLTAAMYLRRASRLRHGTATDGQL